MSLVSSCSLDQGFEAPRRYLAAAAILIGVLMAALDSSIVNVAFDCQCVTGRFGVRYLDHQRLSGSQRGDDADLRVAGQQNR